MMQGKYRQNDFCCCSDMVAMVTMNLLKFHSFFAWKPHFLLAKQILLWKEYENYVKLEEEELLLWENTRNFKLFQEFLCLATTNMVSELILASRELIYGILVNWEPKNSKYGDAVGQEYLTLIGAK